MGRPPKVKPEETTTPIIEETRADDSGVQITFEKADDVADKPKKTIAQEAKDFVKDLFTTDTDTPTKSKGGRPKGSKKTFQNKVKQVATALVWIMSKTMPSLNEKFIINDGEKDTVHQLLPTSEEAQEIVLPLLRIIDRHTELKEINPDVADLCASVWAFSTYAWNTRANLLLLKQIKELEGKNAENNHQQNPFTSNGFESRGPTGAIPIDQTEAPLRDFDL